MYVVDSRARDAFIRRRRKCASCGWRISTAEIPSDLYHTWMSHPQRQDKEADGVTTADTTCVYLMHDSTTDYYKIGRSVDPSTRERTLLAQSPTVRLMCYWSDCKHGDESYLHTTFARWRRRGEWFALNESMVEAIHTYFQGKEHRTVTGLEGVCRAGSSPSQFSLYFEPVKQNVLAFSS